MLVSSITGITYLQLTSGLISSLLTRYAGDLGLSDSLSTRLRDTTPSLFSQKDAVISKANEMVTMATTEQGRAKQRGLLRESLKVGVACSNPALLSPTRYGSLHAITLVLTSAPTISPLVAVQ